MRHISIVIVLLCAISVCFAQQPTAQPADVLWQNACLEYEAKRYTQAQPLFEEFQRRHLHDSRLKEAYVYTLLCIYHSGRKAQSVVDLNRFAKSEIMQKQRSKALRAALDMLAIHYRQDKKPVEWRKAVGRLYKAFPEDAVTIREMRLLAQQALEDTNWADAIQAFIMIEKHLNPEDINGLQLAQTMNSTTGGADVILRMANKHMESDATSTAMRLYNEALKRQPTKDERMEIQTKLGWCLYTQNKYAEAEKLWLQVVADGDSGHPWRGRSRWHLIALNAGPHSNTTKAMELCEIQAKEFEGAFMGQQAMFARAWLLKINRRWVEAKSAFEALIAAYPHKADSPPIKAYIEECNNAIAKK